MMKHEFKNKIAKRILENVPRQQFTPQPYQLELLDNSLSANTIICADSVHLKKFLSLSVLKEFSHEISGIHGNEKEGCKKSLVLMQDVNLAFEYAEYLARHANLHIAVVTHHITMQEWHRAWVDHHVIVMLAELAPQLILMPAPDSDDENIALVHINVLVVDDCQSALNEENVGSQALILIMKAYKTLEKNSQPHILGLADGLLENSVVNPEESTPAHIESKLNRMQDIFHSHAETASDALNVFIHGARPHERVIYSSKPDSENKNVSEAADKCIAAQKEHLLAADKFLADCASIYLHKQESSVGEPGTVNIVAFARHALAECLAVLDTLGAWACHLICRVCLKHLVELELSLPSSDDQSVIDEGRMLLRLTSTTIVASQKFFTEHYDSINTLEEFHELLSPKVFQLIKLLKEYQPQMDFTIEFLDSNGLSNVESKDDSFYGPDDNDMQSDDDDDFSDEELDEDDEVNSKNEISISVPKSPLQNKDTSPGNINPTMYRAVPKCSDSDDGKSDKFNSLIYVQNRFVAYALSKLLDEVCIWDPDLYFIRPGHLYAVRKNTTCLNPRQEDTVKKFRIGEINLLLSTDVVETAHVELPKCALVVRFDTPDNFLSYIQGKSRARAFNATYALLTSSHEEEIFKEQHNAFQSVERILAQQFHDSESYSDSTSDFGKSDDDWMPPYRPISGAGDGGAQVRMTDAISIVNRYCAKLPSDSFTHLTPRWWLTRIPPRNFCCTIRLPINSPFKEVVKGAELPTPKLAKMAAALATVRRLHAENELDENLQPLGKEDMIEDDFKKSRSVTSVDDFMEDSSCGGGGHHIGSAKRRQYYYKRIGTVLTDCRPLPDEDCWLYHVEQCLAAELPEEQNVRGRALYRPERASRGFGLLLRCKLPQVPAFPVFTRSGEERVRFVCNGNPMRLSAHQLDRVLSFHQLVFKRVLRLEKEAVMDFQPDRAYSQMLLAPVLQEMNFDVCIDWQFMRDVEESAGFSPPCKLPPRMDDNQKFEFREEDYLDAVVMPSYRNFDQPQHYYVAEVRYDLSPAHSFPTEHYSSFAEYYSKKYNIRLTNMQQPLLDVDHTSIR